jgi:hypothetical protein
MPSNLLGARQREGLTRRSNMRLHQYTETTINDSRNFSIGKRLCNLPELAQVGFSANRRLLDVERLSSDPTIGQDAFRAVADPIVVNNQRASALPFDSARTQALLSALVVFRLLPHRFRNPDLRAHLAPLLGLDPSLMTQGRMSYDLRRLRLHGLIERIPGTHRYTVTDHGFRLAVFLTRVHNRLLRPGLSEALAETHPSTPYAASSIAWMPSSKTSPGNTG